MITLYLFDCQLRRDPTLQVADCVCVYVGREADVDFERVHGRRPADMLQQAKDALQDLVKMSKEGTANTKKKPGREKGVINIYIY